MWLLLILVEGGVALCATGSSTIWWNPKTLPLRQIQQRARFSLLLPKPAPDGCFLERSQIVWATGDPEYPSRQAVRLVYRKHKGQDAFSIIEVQRIAGGPAARNAYQVISQGYFEPTLKAGTRLHFGTKGGVDFCIMTSVLSHKQVEELVRRLAPAQGKPPSNYRPAQLQPKTMTVRDAQTRVRFDLLVPRGLPQAYRLTAADVAWVMSDPGFPRLPAREAACLVWGSTGGRSYFAVVQAKRVRQVQAKENIHPIALGGYFDSALQKASARQFGTRGGTDFGLFGVGLSAKDIARLVGQLVPYYQASDQRDASRQRTGNSGDIYGKAGRVKWS